MTDTKFSIRYYLPHWLNGMWGGIAIFFTLYILLYLAWIQFHWGGDEYITLIGDLFYLPLEMMTVVIVLRTATRHELGPRKKRAWWFLGLAIASYFVADLCWAYIEIVLNEPPFPSIADIFYLAYIPLTLAGLLNLADPMRARRRYDRQRYWIDLAISALAAAILVWHFVIADTLAENSSELTLLLFATAYPVGDLILITGLLAVWLRRPEVDTRSVLRWVFLALVCFIGSDLAFAYTSLQGTYFSGSWVDTGWSIAILFFQFAALRQLHQTAATGDTTWSRRIDQIGRWGLAGMVLLALGLVVYLGLINGFSGMEFSWITVGALVIVLLVGWRFFGTRGYSDLSLSNKLMVSFLFVTLLPLVSFVYYNTLVTRQNLTENANQSLRAAAAAASEDVDGILTQGLNNVRIASQLHIMADYLALSPAERTGSETEHALYRDLQSIASQDTTYIDAVGLMDRFGRDVADTAAGEVGANKSTHTYVSEPMRTKLPFTSIQFSPTTNRFSLYFSAPVRADNGNVLGVLRVRYNAAILQQIVSKALAEQGIESGDIILLDENHIRLADSNAPELILKSVVPLSTERIAQLKAENRLPSDVPLEELSTNLPDFEVGLNNLASQPIFVGKTLPEGFDNGFEGEEAKVDQIVATRLETLPWLLVASQPQNAYLAPVAAQTRSAVLTVMVIAVLAAVAALALSQTISKPIVQLRDAANQIAGGNLKSQAPVYSRDETGQLAMAFNTMTAQLTRRASELATVAEVGTAASTILDVNTLLLNVVELSKQRFDLYHSHIYLLDETGEHLVLVVGAGEPGRQMVANGHSIPVNREKSLVARAARERKGVTVNDVTQAPDFLPNPLLPNTRSELAVPLIVGDQVLGVFDVQSDQVGRFSESDVDIQSTLASQVAIALQNARAFTQAQRRAERETTLNLISQKIQSTTTVEEALQVAARELGRALRAPLTVAQLGVTAKNGTGSPHRRL